ncbi:MAG: hypothetical protein KIT58_25000 [Planctomycetota bacterium]|nr:hypothetical protein [Planctomycetota bacterium]
MRDRSPVETVLTYATFMALSLALHIVVILGNRPLDRAQADQSRAGQAQEAELAK